MRNNYAFEERNFFLNAEDLREYEHRTGRKVETPMTVVNGKAIALERAINSKHFREERHKKAKEHVQFWGEEISEILTMRDVLSMYCEYTNKDKSRIPCPIHNGRDKNFSYNKTFFQCFSCGAKGNVVSFVAQLFGISNREAMQKIDKDFSLNIYGKHITLHDEIKIEKRKTKRELINGKLAILKNKYDEKVRVFRYLSRALLKDKPTSEDEETWSPVFIYAVQNIAKLERELDELEVKIDELNNGRL